MTTAAGSEGQPPTLGNISELDIAARMAKAFDASTGCYLPADGSYVTLVKAQDCVAAAAEIERLRVALRQIERMMADVLASVVTTEALKGKLQE